MQLFLINFLIVGIIISDNSCFIFIDTLLITWLLLNKVRDKFDVLVSIEKIIVLFYKNSKKSSIMQNYSILSSKL